MEKSGKTIAISSHLKDARGGPNCGHVNEALEVEDLVSCLFGERMPCRELIAKRLKERRPDTPLRAKALRRLEDVDLQMFVDDFRTRAPFFKGWSWTHMPIGSACMKYGADVREFEMRLWDKLSGDPTDVGIHNLQLCNYLRDCAIGFYPLETKIVRALVAPMHEPYVLDHYFKHFDADGTIVRMRTNYYERCYYGSYTDRPHSDIRLPLYVGGEAAGAICSELDALTSVSKLVDVFAEGVR